MASTQITEVKKIKYNCDCVQNPVYLQWQGSNGGANYWLFHTVQAEVDDVDINGQYFPYVEDIETAIGNGETQSKSAQPTLIVGGYIDVEDISGGVLPFANPCIKGLLRSPNVLMLTNPLTWETDGAKWIRIRVAAGTFKILDTNQTKALIEVTLLLPTINLQTQ